MLPSWIEAGTTLGPRLRAALATYKEQDMSDQQQQQNPQPEQNPQPQQQPDTPAPVEPAPVDQPATTQEQQDTEG
jgi:hypothetical protein